MSVTARYQRLRRRSLLCLLLAVAGWSAIGLIAIPEALLVDPAESLALLDRNGVPLRETRVRERFRRLLPLHDVPDHVIHAVLAAEDKRFYHHPGIDFVATFRALGGGLLSGHLNSGASTITQQLVKLAVPRPRTLRTKLIEALTALRIEQSWTKQEILNAYLNRLDFGNLNVGLSAAASYYFHKPVADLSEAEAAFLAGLPLNSRRLNPHSAPDAARRRQQTVLSRMQHNGWLTAQQYERSRTEPLRLQKPRRLFRAPHFVDLVLQQNLPASRTALRTTLDVNLNSRIEAIVSERLLALRDKNVHDAAAVVIENATGDVLALVGSGDYFAPGSGQVNGAWARRSAGSTLKPFTYLLAFEQGATPATAVADVPTAFPTESGPYRPENYNRRCHGPVRYRTALAGSLNIPAVKVLMSAGGPEALIERLKSCGLTTLDRPAEIYGPGLTLGNCETRLLELTNAYAALARLGQFRPWRLFNDAPTAPRQITRPEYAWQIANILQDNAARTLSFGMFSALKYDFPVACKTGTSSDFRDNWTLGFTPEFTAGVWVGNFDGEPMHEVSGVTGAAPILHAIFEHLHARSGTSWYPLPAQMLTRAIHPITGKLLADSDPRAVRETFLATQLPAAESPADYAGQKVRLGPEYTQWLGSAENALGDRVTAAGNDAPLQILSPAPGSTYIIDPDLPSSHRIPLTLTGATAVEWSCPTMECVSEDGHSFALAVVGQHQLTVRDPDTGRSAQTWLSIRAL